VGGLPWLNPADFRRVKPEGQKKKKKKRKKEINFLPRRPRWVPREAACSAQPTKIKNKKNYFLFFIFYFLFFPAGHPVERR
jgi:hypothetical protein